MNIVISSVEVQEDRFLVQYTVDGGDNRGHVFPADTLEWRAAEYGLDPQDRETLLEIVLYEPFLDSHSIDDPKHLFNAATIKEARDHHLGRIADLKAQHTISDPDGHLKKVTDNALMHPVALDLKRDLVTRARAARRVRKLGGTDGDRVNALQQRLARNDMPASRDPEEGLPPDSNAMLRRKR